MMQRHLMYVLMTLGLLMAVVAGSLSRINPATAQEVCFPERPEVPCLTEPFASYWAENGGLPVFGYPLAAPQEEVDPVTGVPLLTQWTERYRLESHPENQPPYNVLLGRMGAEQLEQLGRNPQSDGRESGPQPGCLWFEETGHNVCNQGEGAGFRAFWERNGIADPRLSAYGQSLALFGLPLTAARQEVNPTNGQVYLTQWFERARFEWHPDNPAGSRVLMGLLGQELRSDDRPALEVPPSPLSAFGGEINRRYVEGAAERAREADLQWIRYNGINWSEVEATQGVRDWSALAQVESDLRLLSANDLAPVVIVRNAPLWARSNPDSACTPIKPEALDAFADFLRELVTRYSVPPYNVHYWELGNEPDAPFQPDGSPFGCWGDPDEPFYGGGYYAEMLQRAYPAIKQADPDAQVVLGGLLLDCDPDNPPENKDCTIGRFFEGILQNGGGSSFDIVGYHAYAFWSPDPIDWDRRFISWEHRGGTLLGKRQFLIDVMSRYGIAKPLIANEIGLLCYQADSNSDFCREGGFFEDKATHLIRIYTRAAAYDIGAAWYTVDGPGWRLGGLLTRNDEPQPAYMALTFLTERIGGAEFVAILSDEWNGLEGYEFNNNGTRYQIYWVNAGEPVDLPLPANTNAVYTDGQLIQTSGASVVIGQEPVIIELVD